MAKKYKTKSIFQRFEKYKKIDEITNCWNWDGSLDRYGYGKINIKINGVYKTIQVHRYAFLVYRNIELDESDIVCHQCHNRKCFNPDHLKISTTLNNILEKRKDWDDFKKDNERLVSNYKIAFKKLKDAYFKWHRNLGNF